MLAVAMEHIGERLLDTGHCLTSYEELGVVPDDILTGAVVNTAPQYLERHPDDSYASNRLAMSEGCQAAARQLMQPLVDVLFVDVEEDVRLNWLLFGINYYLTGQFLRNHQDFENPCDMTVVIASVTGQRNFVVRGIDHQPHRYILTPDDVMLLDGHANPWHLANCTLGPSISVVADVAAIIRTA